VTDASPEGALARIALELGRRGRSFALVGGLGVSIRGEVRFTRDVDVAIAVASDAETEALIRELTASGYAILVEQEERKRLATVRLRSPNGVVVDLLAASAGIEREIVERATTVMVEGVGAIPVARAEELLAMKVLSMTDARPQDRIDALNLLACNATLRLDEVQELLATIEQRGFHREQDLTEKLRRVLADRPVD
jgi:hypothetical protein